MCVTFYLEIISDEAFFDSSRSRILDCEVPAAKDLVAHVHTVTFPEHPGVLVAHDSSVGKFQRWESQKGKGVGRWSLWISCSCIPDSPASHHDETEEEDGEDSKQVQQRCIQALQIQGTSRIETKEDGRTIQVALQEGRSRDIRSLRNALKNILHMHQPLPIPGRNP